MKNADILVVEDDPLLAEELQDLLVGDATAVSVAHSKKEAILSLESREFALLICDVNLGDGDGFDVLKQARKLQPRLRIIVVSGEIGDSVTARAFIAGAYAGFTKPVDSEELLASVRSSVRDTLRKRAA